LGQASEKLLARARIVAASLGNWLEENLGGNASGIRLKALQSVGQKNSDADHAKQCGNYLDHSNCPLCPAETKQHGRPNSQKNSMSNNGFAGRLMISGNRASQENGKPPARLAFGWQHPG
jgi:hypothetical protein